MPSDALQEKVSLARIFGTFFQIGGISFGGGVVAYLRDGLVEQRQWLNDDEFLEALEVSQTLPGLNATNMAVIVGDRLRGLLGSLVAFVGITLPGTVIVMALALAYTANSGNPAVIAVLHGVGAASVGLLLSVSLKLGHKQLEHRLDIVLVVITVVMVSFIHVSLLWTLLILAPIAVILYRPRKVVRTATD